ncbi:MAG: tetratricopeptide repeat protein [Ornithinimicrobium sp.]
MHPSTARASISLVAVLLVGTLIVGPQIVGGPPPLDPVAASESATSVDPLSASIADLQQKLEDQPEDSEKWAGLGAAYVEQARVTADPSYYPKAEGALEKSLDLQSEGNEGALTALGALANARHDFDGAADYAEQAQEINAANPTSWGVLADASIQLGEYDEATAAAQQMLDLRPGLASYSRASYDLELHGERERAVDAMELALKGAYSPADIAFCTYYLGQLAFNSGDLEEATTQFERGLAAVPDDPTLLAGRARVYAAQGDEDRAVETFDRVVAARPLPDYLVEYGFYLDSIGRTAEADEQFATVQTVQALFEANGVQDDLTSAHVAADRGDPKTAVKHAKAEWKLRQNIDAADAMAWALHRADRDDEALGYAKKANALDGDNALFLYHQGIIEQSLGMDEAARKTLRTALDTNPYFSPLHAPLARQALIELGG